jgi:hypothetical protein
MKGVDDGGGLNRGFEGAGVEWGGNSLGYETYAGLTPVVHSFTQPSQKSSNKGLVNVLAHCISHFCGIFLFHALLQEFMRFDGTPPLKTLVEVIDAAKPHVLIGLSGHGPAFFQEDVEAMCSSCEQPLIFPLSNPTTK